MEKGRWALTLDICDDLWIQARKPIHRNILIEMVCACVFRTLHLQGMGRTDFSLWHTDIQKAAGGKANTLKDQQLSRNDIPIIVDSCIAFITQYGEDTKCTYECILSSNAVLHYIHLQGWIIACCCNYISSLILTCVRLVNLYSWIFNVWNYPRQTKQKLNFLKGTTPHLVIVAL